MKFKKSVRSYKNTEHLKKVEQATRGLNKRINEENRVNLGRLRKILSIIIITSPCFLVLALVAHLRFWILILIFWIFIIWLVLLVAKITDSPGLNSLGGCLILLILILSLPATGLIIYSINNAIYLGPFKDHVREYVTVSGLKNPARSSPHRTQAYLKGKIIPVNKTENKIDDIYYSLPEGLRATKPEDVGTIVWLDWGEDKVGHYCSEYIPGCFSSDDPAIVNTCDVTIIDKSIPAIVVERNFRGSDPPQKTKGGGASGSMPTEEIVDYLQNLPKK
jgi:hypothetical protein